MKPMTLLFGAAAALLIVSCPEVSHAQTSYDGFIAGVTVPYGARSGWGGGDAMIVGGGAFLGWRSLCFRGGALARALYWRAQPGTAVDVGGFASFDLASIWITPRLSMATFTRLEPALRWVSSTSRWAFAPSGVLGGRAAGVEIGVGVTPEIGLSTVQPRIGLGATWTLGVELVELSHFIGALHDESKKLPP